MYIYDTSKKEKCKLEPIYKKDVKIYVCGPTVYDDAHLGHARSSIAFDLLRRILGHLYFNVTFMKNITDVDDKIIKKANENGESIQAVTDRYLERFNKDMAALGVITADLEPKATENIDNMVEMIQNLAAKDIAYKMPNGDVYFDIAKDKHYCSISHRCEDETQTQSRIETVEGKRNSGDFALWKIDEINGFESILGKGRPGWHIECSAMIDKHLKYDEGEYSIDIHAGGADLLFPHHENEASQSRCANDQELAKYWMHNGFVNINNEKMSKSLGNSFFIKDALEKYDGEILRFYLLSIHYRSDFNYNDSDLQVSKKRLDKLYRLKKRVYGGSEAKKPNAAFAKAFVEALSDDINISVALSAMDHMLMQSNERLDHNESDKALKKEILANIELITKLIGIGDKDPFNYFQLGMDSESKEKIETLLAQRDTAKKEKNYILADQIRDELSGMNVKLMDTPKGTVWEIV
jgi:cysteinyl-tRNA synthetase